MRKPGCVLLVAMLIAAFIICEIPASALQSVQAQKTAESLSAVSGTDSEYGLDYQTYLKENGNTDAAQQDETVLPVSESPFALTSGETRDFTVNSGDGGWFELSLSYYTKDSAELVFSLKIDDAVPFFEARKISFPSLWENDGASRYDNYGNEISPKQTVSGQYEEMSARDYVGSQENPYLFYIPAGVHRITLISSHGNAEIEKIAFRTPEKIQQYAQGVTEPEKNELSGKTVVTEGESAVLKSSRDLIPLCDSQNAEVSPSSPTQTKLNYIGGESWKNPGDLIEWQVEVPANGYYKLGFMYRQNVNLGGISYRWLKIDGKRPLPKQSKSSLNMHR